MKNRPVPASPMAIRCAIAALFILLSMVSSTLYAQDANEEAASEYGFGNLGISKNRMVFEGRTRTNEILLINQGATTTTYRIYFQDLRMKEDGSYEEIAEPQASELFAADMIRFSPRRVVVAPGAVQSVRLLLRKPRDLAAGEYRSHLTFQTVPPPTIGQDVEDRDLAEGEVQIRLVPILSLSIPVIVRHQTLPVEVNLSDLDLIGPSSSETPPILFVRLNRDGNRSSYGDLIVDFLTDEKGQGVQVGSLLGVAVFTPNESRTVNIPLRPPEGVSLERGRLRVVYREREDAGGEVLAEAEIAVP